MTSCSPRPRLIALAAALVATGAFAQTSPPADDTPSGPVQRVEITGSAIKRIDGETALPVQIIKREDIAKAGITTAAEIMAKITANTNGLTDGGSISTGGYHDQTGFNGANLRGIGASSTLVLLNGRRMANFASPGDDAGVDLNNIPAAAIERVEVLLDGASALYGTDAIGGVINFITRSDFQGAEVSAYVGATQEGGAGKREFSLAAGAGSLDDDGFNVFGVFDVQRTDSLNANQRKFIADLRIPERLPHLLSSATQPGNIRLGWDQFDILEAEGFSTNGKDVISTRTINLSAPNCNPPHTLYLPDGIGGVDGCTFDYMRDVELYPKSDKLSFLGRGVLKLGSDSQAYAELSLARAKSYYVGTSNRVDADIDVALIPELAATGLGELDADDENRIITVRTRLLDAGRRVSELTSTGTRLVVGTSGSLGKWDYDVALNRSVNTVADRDKSGYLLYTPLMAGFADGTLTPFGTQSPAGQALLDSLQVDDVARRARGTMTGVDGKLSTVLGRLDGGDIGLALGAEFRREVAEFHPSALLLSDEITGDPTPGGGQDISNGRSVAGVYGEMDLPVTKALNLQLAARYDRYQGVGGTFNPKAALAWSPAPEWKARASVGTGFRAPSLADLYRPARGGTTSVLPDPVYCAENDNDYSYCADEWDTYHFSNPNLKPERSTQFSAGLLFQPTDHWSFSADYWSIHKRDVISEIGEDVILSNPTKYASLIHRYSDPAGDPNSLFMQQCGDDLDVDDNSICFIELHKANRGQLRTSGVDLVAEMQGLRTDWGMWGVRMAGTLVLQSEQQTAPGDPFVSNLGRFVTDGAVQRWRHRLTVNWEQGPFGISLGNTYLSGYEDQNSAIDTSTGSVVTKNHVAAYSLWDLSGAWAATPELKLRAGVQNLFNTSPPFSNQAYFFINGYDPSYTDPRGRFYYVSATYRFK